MTALSNRRKPQTKTQKAKVKKVMREFQSGRLHSSNGAKVRNRKQAMAIALSEAGVRGDAYAEGFSLSKIVAPGTPSAYSAGVREHLERQDNKPQRSGYVWVEDRRVKAGGYWRKNRTGTKAEVQQTQSNRRVATSAAAGAALGLMVGAGGAAFLATWANRDRVKQKVSEAEESAEADYKKKLSKSEKGHSEELKEVKSKEQENFRDREKSINRKAEASLKEKKRELGRKFEGRRQELEEEFERNTANARSQMKSELDQRTVQIREQAHREAMERIVSERESALKAARDEIIAATQPKARKPGDIATDDKKGIALAASVRQGLDLGTLSTDAKKRRISDANRRLIAKQYQDGLNDLNARFRERTKQIQSIGSDRTPQNTRQANAILSQRWEAMEKAMLSQSRREGAFADQVTEIRKSTNAAYQKALMRLEDQAQGRGGYEPDLLDAFDVRAKAINAKARRAVDQALKSSVEIKFDAISIGSAAYRSGFGGVLQNV